MKIKKNSKLFLAVFFIFLFLLILNFNFYPFKIKGAFYKISLPFQNFFWGLGIKVSNFFEGFLLTEKIKSENEELKNKVYNLTFENISLQELKKENEFLKKSLDINPNKEFKMEIVKILFKDLGKDFILINKGYSSGISKKNPVITEGKVLVGRVIEVWENFSKVQLISDKEFSFGGKIKESEIQGLIKGKGDLKLIFDLVPKEKEVLTDQVVVTNIIEESSVENLFPENLLIGKITKVKKESAFYFQEIEISPFFDLGKTEFLFVITAF